MPKLKSRLVKILSPCNHGHSASLEFSTDCVFHALILLRQFNNVYCADYIYKFTQCNKHTSVISTLREIFCYRYLYSFRIRESETINQHANLSSSYQHLGFFSNKQFSSTQVSGSQLSTSAVFRNIRDSTHFPSCSTVSYVGET